MCITDRVSKTLSVFLFYSLAFAVSVGASAGETTSVVNEEVCRQHSLVLRRISEFEFKGDDYQIRCGSEESGDWAEILPSAEIHWDKIPQTGAVNPKSGALKLVLRSCGKECWESDPVVAIHLQSNSTETLVIRNSAGSKIHFHLLQSELGGVGGYESKNAGNNFSVYLLWHPEVGLGEYLLLGFEAQLTPYRAALGGIFWASDETLAIRMKIAENIVTGVRGGLETWIGTGSFATFGIELEWLRPIPFLKIHKGWMLRYALGLPTSDNLHSFSLGATFGYP
jgi:hypothetical protein